MARRAVVGGGTPLSREVRGYFEPRFGHDFSHVRIHADSTAAGGALAVQARAYTVGRDIAFASGEYTPATPDGRRLLAHELVHVTQQNAGTNAVQRKTGEPAPEGPEAFADQRKRTDTNFAVKIGRRDAARIRKAGKLSIDDRQDLNAGLRFFEGEAKDAYVRQIRPMLLKITPEHPATEIEMPAEPVTPRARKAAAAESELLAWKTDMLMQLMALKFEILQMRLIDIPVLQKNVTDLQEAALQAAEIATIAKQKALESAASARRWTRIAAGAKIILSSVELVVSCPQAFDPLGAAGCIHALSSYTSSWDELWHGEASPTAVQLAAKSFAMAINRGMHAVDPGIPIDDRASDAFGNFFDSTAGTGLSMHLSVPRGVPKIKAGPPSDYLPPVTPSRMVVDPPPVTPDPMVVDPPPVTPDPMVVDPPPVTPDPMVVDPPPVTPDPVASTQPPGPSAVRAAEPPVAELGPQIKEAQDALAEASQHAEGAKQPTTAGERLTAAEKAAAEADDAVVKARAELEASEQARRDATAEYDKARQGPRGTPRKGPRAAETAAKNTVKKAVARVKATEGRATTARRAAEKARSAVAKLEKVQKQIAEGAVPRLTWPERFTKEKWRPLLGRSGPTIPNAVTVTTVPLSGRFLTQLKSILKLAETNPQQAGKSSPSS